MPDITLVHVFIAVGATTVFLTKNYWIGFFLSLFFLGLVNPDFIGTGFELLWLIWAIPVCLGGAFIGKCFLVITSKNSFQRRCVGIGLPVVALSLAGALIFNTQIKEKNKKDEVSKATDFVKNHKDVIEKVGNDIEINQVSSSISSSGVLMRYEFSVTPKGSSFAIRQAKKIFAIVDVSRAGSDLFSIACLTSIQPGNRDPFKDPCKQ